jgi:hypothetical protein
MKNYEATQELGAEELVAEHTGRMSVTQASELILTMSVREELCRQLGLPGGEPGGDLGALVLIKFTIEAGVRAVVFDYTLNKEKAAVWMSALHSLTPVEIDWDIVKATIAPWVARVAQATITSQW